MGAGASLPKTESEKAKAYDALAAQYPDLVAKGYISEQAQKAVKTVTDKDEAAQKLQALARGTETRKEQQAPVDGESMLDIFNNFNSIYRQELMTNTTWAKFCKDGKLLDKKFTKPQIDMVWSKAAGKEKKVGYSVFENMIQQVAVIKGKSYEDLCEFVKENAKVKNTGTTGESRFYDDKDTWTGAAAKGGVDSSLKKEGLKNLTDRDNKADIRGSIG